MNISALSDTDLSRWICEKFEPTWRRDIVNDPAMTVMLLYDLLERHDVKLERGNGVVHLDVFDGSAWSATEATTLGRAVAEAWAIANGWKP